MGTGWASFGGLGAWPVHKVAGWSKGAKSIRSAAISADAAGLDDFWLSEDCFKESAVASAVAALAATERVRVGIALLPVPLRSVAQAAMELATI
ncbi:LLM class flavin-dependent oxidoreductase [Kribbella catacumbae]|uniref:LLM class flavin-dependent oxidoreductase n=1 Tax=Kribbella catacumbae TaxID=460086 RepID=UPI00039FB8C4|nr:LLM class flavin-dependent oxidoreductase [Kribbella catacumbae]